MPEPDNSRPLAILTVITLALIGLLALGPPGMAWRLPIAALAIMLVLEVRRRSGQHRPASRPRPLVEQKVRESFLSTGLYDPLTRLPNRTLLNELLEKQVAQARRSGRVLGVVVCDVDRFKSFNDSLGQRAGDRLLRHLARRFQGRIREADTLGRTGGDAFTLVVPRAERADDVVLAAKRMLAILKDPFTIDETEVLLSASAGISVFPADASEPALLLSHAEEALARAKAQGGNNLQLFAPSMNRRTRERTALEQELRRAIADQALTVHYQPQVSLVDGRLTGMEALVRWPHPQQGLLSAGVFIPLAEDGGLMNDLGTWLLGEICLQNADWSRRGIASIPISVNVSIRQFQSGDLVGVVEHALEQSGLRPDLLHLEITESIAMLETERITETLRSLKDLGVMIHLDDFGTGYSSLSYLLRYPVDFLKIDRSFIDGVPQAEGSAKIVRLTISLARSLDLGLIAEGVETPAQLAFLRDEGCAAAQGYLLGKPAPAGDFEALLGSGRIDLERLAKADG